MKASSSCGFSVVVHPEGVVIAVHYAPCLEETDGMYTLELTGDGESKISCPSLSASQPEPTESSYPHPEDHYQHSKPAIPGLPQFPESSPGKPHDIVAPTMAPNPHVPYYPFPFYVPLPQPGSLPTQPPVTEPPVKYPAGHPEDHEPNPSSPFVFYNQPLVDQAFFNEPHRGHAFYQDSFHHGFLASDHYPMPMPLPLPLQETFASSPQSQASQHPEALHVPSMLVQQLEQVSAPSSNGINPQSVIQQPSSGGAVPPDSAWFASVHCPQVCPSGINCCPQMAFHQYLHLVPSGFGSKRSVFGSSWRPVHHPQNPTEPLQPRAARNQHNYLRPPEGVHAAHARRYHSELPSHELPDNFYNLPHVDHSFHPVPYKVPLRPWTPGRHAFNQRMQFEPYNVHGPKQRNDQASPVNAHHPTGHHFMNTFGQNKRQQQNKPAAWQLQPSHPQARESPEMDIFNVPDHTLQEAQAPTYKTPLVPNSQTPPSGHTVHEQTVHSDSDPKSNVLLHHGPPGWNFDSWSDSQLPFKELLHDPNFVPQNFPREQYLQASWDR